MGSVAHPMRSEDVKLSPAGRVMRDMLFVTLVCVALMGALALIVDQDTNSATLREEPQ